MKFTKRIRISSIVSLGMLIVVVPLLVWSSSELKIAADDGILADDLQTLIFQRVVVRDEYFLHGKEQARLRMLALTAQTAQLLQKGARQLTAPAERKVLEEMQTDLNGTIALFERLVERVQRIGASREGRHLHHDELGRRLYEQIMPKTSSLQEASGRLQDLTRERSRRAINRTLVLTGIFVFLTAAVIMLNSSFINRLLRRRLETLRVGAAIIGSGDLGYRMQFRGSDELTELGTLLNRMMGRLQDHTAQLHESEKRIRLQLQELSHIYTHSPVGLFVVDRDLRFLRVNEHLAQINGVSMEGHLGRTIGEVLPADLAADLREIWRPILERGESVLNVELQGTTLGSPGATRHWLASYHPLCSEMGEVIGLMGTVIDITEARYADLERHKLASLVEMSPDFISMATLEGTVTYMNQAALQMVGLTSLDEAIGRHVTDLYPDRYQQQANDRLSAALLDRGVHLAESCYRHFRTGAEIPVEVNTFVITDHLGTPICRGAVTRDITRRKRVEAELLKSRDQYLELFENFPTLIWRSDTDAKCNYLNPTWLEFTGRTLEQELGDGWAEGLHPADVERCLKSYLDAFHDRRPFELEYRLRHRDGGYRWIVSCGRPYYDLNKEFAGYIGSCHDQSQQKKDQFEQQLLRQERDLLTERLQVVLERMPIGCVLLDHEFMVTYWNRACEALLGFSQEEVLGRSPYDTFVPASAAEYVQTVEAQMRNADSVVPGFNQNRTKDGRLITCEWHNTTMRGANGEVSGFISMALDVTERIKAQEELQRSERTQQQLNSYLSQALKVMEDALNGRIKSETALLRSKQELQRVNSELKGILDAVEESLILYSKDMEILWSNRKALKYFGGAPDTSEEPASAHGLVRDCFHSGTQFVDQMARGTGQVLDILVYPIYDVKGEVQSVLEVVRDVTAKANQQSRAVRSAHLASLGELAAGVAHEINNPIHGIINYAEHLARKYPGESRVLDISQRIVKESERVAHIVRALLDFSRKKDGGKVRVRIEEILNDSLTLCKSQLRKDNIRVFRDPERSDLPEVLAEPQQIIQVILNLISNARYSLNEKYPNLDDRKSITFSLSEVTVDEKHWVQVALEDQGGGIPQQLLHKVLNPFFSTKASGSGTGLGLSICNTIIAEHGGRLEIASAEGVSTTVTFLLPVWRKDAV